MLTPDSLKELLNRSGYKGFKITRLTRRVFWFFKFQTDTITITHPGQLTAISAALEQANVSHEVDKNRIVVDLAQVD